MKYFFCSLSPSLVHLLSPLLFLHDHPQIPSKSTRKSQRNPLPCIWDSICPWSDKNRCSKSFPSPSPSTLPSSLSSLPQTKNQLRVPKNIRPKSLEATPSIPFLHSEHTPKINRPHRRVPKSTCPCFSIAETYANFCFQNQNLEQKQRKNRMEKNKVVTGRRKRALRSAAEASSRPELARPDSSVNRKRISTKPTDSSPRTRWNSLPSEQRRLFRPLPAPCTRRPCTPTRRDRRSPRDPHHWRNHLQDDPDLIGGGGGSCWRALGWARKRGRERLGREEMGKKMGERNEK